MMYLVRWVNSISISRSLFEGRGRLILMFLLCVALQISTFLFLERDVHAGVFKIGAGLDFIIQK